MSRIQLVFTHFDHSTSYHVVVEQWRVDVGMNCVVIDRGLPRTLVPLSNVKCFTVERLP